MSRRAPRVRAQLTATVTPLFGEGALVVCRTRDVSDVGMALDIDEILEPGTRVSVSIMDPMTGNAVEVIGEVSRMLAGTRGVGIRLYEVPDEWIDLVAAQALRSSSEAKRPRRLRVLVVGDGQRQRGALALYVTSGWDVRFASDLDGAVEALRGFRLDAVVAEHDVRDGRWQPILDEVRRLQPAARRIVRGMIIDDADDAAGLVHRFVDRDAGLEALLDALTADLTR